MGSGNYTTPHCTTLHHTALASVLPPPPHLVYSRVYSRQRCCATLLCDANGEPVFCNAVHGVWHRYTTAMRAPHPQGARGADGDVIVLDEAAYIPPAFLLDVVVPMMQKTGVVVLGISTSGGPTNYYTKMKDMIDDMGMPLFRFITITRICAKCQQGLHPEKCVHRLHLMPPWKNLSRFNLCEKMLRGMSASMEREILGLLDRESGGAFNLRDIDALKAAHAVSSTAAARAGNSIAQGPVMDLPELIFLTVDPGPGTSDTAMLASCYDNVSHRVVVRSFTPLAAPSAHAAIPMSTRDRFAFRSALSRAVPPPALPPSMASRLLHTSSVSIMPAVHAPWAWGMDDAQSMAVGVPLHRSVNALGRMDRNTLRCPGSRWVSRMVTRSG